MYTHRSDEIARLRQQISREYQTARQGLSAFFQRYDFIQAKTENIGKRHDNLLNW